MQGQGLEHLDLPVAAFLGPFDSGDQSANQLELLLQQDTQRRRFVSAAARGGDRLDLVGETRLLARLQVPSQFGDLAIGMLDRRDELTARRRCLGSEVSDFESMVAAISRVLKTT